MNIAKHYVARQYLGSIGKVDSGIASVDLLHEDLRFEKDEISKAERSRSLGVIAKSDRTSTTLSARMLTFSIHARGLLDRYSLDRFRITLGSLL